jgi:hypothetical protein
VDSCVEEVFWSDANAHRDLMYLLPYTGRPKRAALRSWLELTFRLLV